MNANSAHPRVLRRQGKLGCSGHTRRCPTYLSIMAAALCVVHLLLPIERGFPVVRIAGYPVTLTLLVSTLSMLILFMGSNGRIITSFPKKYLPYQLVVVWFFLISAFISDDVEASLFVVLSYCATFVLDFLIIYYLFKLGFRQHFVNIMCAVVAVAALIGIAESVFRYYMPFYRDWFLTYNYQAMQHAMTRSDFRVLGTLGNPIIYSVVMVLAFPFALEIRYRLLRILMVGILLIVTVFAVSTTTAMMWLVLLSGLFLVSGRKTRFKFLIAAVAVIVIALLISRFLKDAMGSLVSGWSREFAVGEQANEQLINIQIRLDLFLWVFTRFTYDPVSLLFGHGLKSAILTVQTLGLGSLATLDNTYTTIFFESGALGLMAFLAVGSNVLVGHRWAIRKNLHWYSILSLLVAGFAFTTIYYATFNLIWVASVATLAFDTQGRSNRCIVPS